MSEEKDIDVAVIACHPDDAEIGMGGTILSLIAEGKKVALLDLTDGEPTPMGDPQTRYEESCRAAKELGVYHREQLGLPNRFLKADLASRKKLAGWLRRFRPKLIFTHYWEDAHPDHVAGCRLVEEARFFVKLHKSDLEGEPMEMPRLLHFYSNHYRLIERADLVLDISKWQEQKHRAVFCYESQFNKERGNLEKIRKKLRDTEGYWGSKIGTCAAEVFASRELLGWSSLRDLC